VLELGAGTGRVALAIAKAGVDVGRRVSLVRLEIESSSAKAT
jgi:ubiquinone/menaquinone biosynthesis C-methylase UbiE